MTQSKKFREEIIKLCKENRACEEEFKRLISTENDSGFCQVLKDNFSWCVRNNVLTVDIIERHKEVLNANSIYVNQNIDSGYMLVYNATVKAWDNATVEARDNATVEAWGNATVKAWGNATVKAWGNATVKALDNATVEAWDNATVEAGGNATVKARDNAYISSYSTIECKLSDNAIHRIKSTNTVKYSNDNIKFEKQ